MEAESIIPDVIDTVPPYVLEITYEDNVKVELGKELTPTEVKEQPNVTWDADPNALYTLIMTDPDVPNRKAPKFSVLHWLVVNIPGNDLKAGKIIGEYLPSGPRVGSGLHRYVFLLYKQSEELHIEEHIPSMVLKGRYNFSARKYATKHNLGEPVAGNFYQAQYDDYVLILQDSIEL